MPGSAFNPQQDAIAKLVQQTDHGFSVGNVLRKTLGGYSLALADLAENAEVCGIVIAVVDADSFRMALEGHIDCFSGFTPDTVYWLSPSVPGELTVTQPTTAGQIQKPVLISTSSTSGYFVTLRGVIVPDGGGGGGSTAIWQDNAETGLFANVVSLVNRDRKLGLYDSTGAEGFNIGRDFNSANANNLFVFDKGREAMCFYIDDIGRTLIGDAQDPSEMLDVRGGIRLGQCMNEEEGTMSFDSGDLWVRLNGSWVSLTAGGGTTPDHNNLNGLNAGDYQHLTATEKGYFDELVGGQNTTLHSHAGGGGSLWEAGDVNGIKTIGGKRVYIATAQFNIGDGLPAIMLLQCDSAYNSPPAMAITCMGKYNSSGTYAGFGTFGIHKANATDGNLRSDFKVCLRNDTFLYEMFRILSTGEVYNPYTRATGYFDIGRDETDKTSRLVVRGEQISWGGTSMPHVLRLHDNRDYNYNSFGNCPGISFAGKYNSGGGWLDWGAIACRKESLTDSEMRSCFSIWLNRDLTVTEKFRISSLGYVGINTTSPGYYLHVNGTACASPPVGTMGLLVYANGGTCSMAITPIGGTPSEIRLHTGGTGQWFNISDGDGTGYTVMIRGGKLGVNMGQYGAPLEKMHTNGGLLLENDSISTSNLVTGYKTALSSDTSGFMVRSTQEHTKFILGSQWSYPSLTMYSFRSNPPPNYYNSRRFQFLFDSDSTTMYPWVIFSGKHQGASERDYMFMGQNDQTQEFYTRFPDNVVIEGTLTVNGEHDAFWTDGGTYIYPTDGEAIHLYGNGSYYQLGLFDTTASNSGVGGCLGFFGKDSNEDYQELSRIRASKSASADSARLDFYVNTGTSLALACYMGVDRGLHMVTDGTYIGWGTFTTDGAWQGIKADSGDMCYDIYTTGTAGIPSGMHSFRVANDGVVTPVLALGGDGSNYFSHFSGLMGVAGQVTFDTNTAFQILNNSNTRAKAIAWDTYSDARIKDNIVASPKGLAELLLVSPKKYRQYSSKPVWEEENERWIHEVDGNSYVEKYGFIAQDLMTVIPEVVPTLVNADKELYGIDYNQLIPIIVKAIQELNAKIPA